MRIITLFLVAGFFAMSCETETTQRIEGEFLYIADAAVLKGDDFIYGVELNELTTELAQQAEGYKRDDFDMVPVIVEGIVKPKPENAEGWEEIVEITKILAVMHPTGEQGIKIESEEK